MNTLRLVRLLYSKRLLREALIVLQVILMVILLNAVILPFENVRVNERAVSSQLTMKQQQTVYYTPSLAYTESYLMHGLRADTITQALRKNPDIEAVAQYYERDAAFEHAGETWNTMLNVYSDALFHHLKLPLEKGEFAASGEAYGTGVLPVVIGGRLAELYQVGDAFTLGWLGGEAVSIPCVVTGVLRNNASFITLGEQNAVLSYNTAFEQKKSFLFARYDADRLKGLNWGLPMLLQLREGVDPGRALDTLREQYGNYGEYHTIPELMSDAREQVVKNSQWNIMMLILFGLVLVFGYGGYLLVSAMQKSRLYAVLYINGVSIRRMLWINILSGLLLIVPAVGAGLALSPAFLENYVQADFIGFTPGTYAAILMIFLLMFLFSVAAVLIQSSRLSTISLYQQDG